jgi:hypothetical protein
MLVPAMPAVLWGCFIQRAQSATRAETPDAASPVVAVTLDDGSTLQATMFVAEGDVLRVVSEGRKLDVPLHRIERLALLRPRWSRGEDSAGSRRHRIRIGVARIELPSRKDAANRLDRIGADWQFISSEAPLEQLQQYDVVYFPAGWGRLAGLANLAEVYRQYVEQGGGLLFAEPDADGDPTRTPALRLLPYPITVRASALSWMDSVVEYHPGRPHPLTQEIDAADLPHAVDGISPHDARWTVLAKTPGNRPVPTLLVAEVGQGRVVLHTNRDDYGHEQYFRDAMVVRIVKWLARLPDEEVRSGGGQLGLRRWPEFARELEADYSRLIADEPAQVRAALERAEQVLRFHGRQSNSLVSTQTALKLVHANRSKAAIPLLLKLLADDGLSHDEYREEIYKAFAFLTGRPVRGRTAEEVARQWWFPQKERITIDIGKMSVSQREVVMEQLLDVVANSEPMGKGRRPPLSVQTLDSVLEGGYRVYARDYRPALHRRLLPVLLSTAQDPNRRWLLLGPLAAMYRLGRANELPRLVSDETVPQAARVIAAAALYRAGEPVPVEPLTRMFRRVSESDLQMAVILLLSRSEDPAAVETVQGCLHDPRHGFREAAELVVKHR